MAFSLGPSTCAAGIGAGTHESVYNALMSLKLSDYETTPETAARLGIDSSQIRRYCEQDRLEGAVKIAGRWLIPKDSTPHVKHFGRPPTWRSEGEPRA